METSRSKFIGYLLICLIAVGLIAIMYLAFVYNRKISAPVGIQPSNIQSAIEHPIEINGDWRTLVRTDEYEISYSEVGDSKSFFITINSKPVLENSQVAEQVFLRQLGIDQGTACNLPLSMGVPSSVDSNLSGYTFGLSFCSGKLHISDVLKN